MSTVIVIFDRRFYKTKPINITDIALAASAEQVKPTYRLLSINYNKLIDGLYLNITYFECHAHFSCYKFLLCVQYHGISLLFSFTVPIYFTIQSLYINTYTNHTHMIDHTHLQEPYELQHEHSLGQQCIPKHDSEYPPRRVGPC